MNEDELRDALAFKANSLEMARLLILELNQSTSRNTWGEFTRAHINRACELIGDAINSLYEAQQFVGMEPMQSIEHDRERYEKVQLEADRYRRVEENG